MKVHQSLLADLQNALPKIDFSDPDFFKKTERIMLRTLSTLEAFQEGIEARGFENKKEEITFFKTIKPVAVSILFFHFQLSRIKTLKGFETPKSVKKFYRKQIAELAAYFQEHKEFYEYWRRHQTHRDEEYFLTKPKTIFWHPEILVPLLDANFNTAYDLVLGKFMGIEKTIAYLKGEIEKKPHPVPSSASPKLRWTGSKVDLVELIYALHLSGALNNGEVNMSDLAQGLQQLFSIELGDIYRTFIEIRERKTAPTKFLNTLKSRLIHKMQTADA